MGVLIGKKVVVLGLGKSGVESALFLKKQGALVFASDMSLDLLDEKELLEEKGVVVTLGSHPKEEVVNCNFVVCSPGIPPDVEIVRLAKSKHKLVISEIELAFRFFEGKIIGITGTNGKTTTTTLCTQLLKHFGMNAFSCGNIGSPFILEIQKHSADSTAVIELSSFQLEHIYRFKPDISIFLNCEPDHLNWHKNFENYKKAKLKIFDNQTDDNWAVINFKDQVIQDNHQNIKAQKLFFNQEQECENPNWNALLKVSEIYGWNQKEVLSFLRDSPGIEHRLEKFEIDGQVFINDSKSTNPSSLAYALDQQTEKVVLICGGKNKGASFSSLSEKIKQKVELVIGFGESGEELLSDLGKNCETFYADNLQEVLIIIKEKNTEKYPILFSPGCASFDQFDNYEHRGTEFKQRCKELFGGAYAV